MFILMLHVDGIATPFGLRFREAPMEMLKEIRERVLGAHTLDLSDDYGQHISVPSVRLLVPQVIDVAKDMAAQGEMALLQQRAQARMQSAVTNDPVMALQTGKLVRAS